MNPIIQNNQHKIGTDCILCFHALAKYDHTVTEYKGELAKIDPIPFVEEAKERRRNALRTELASRVKGVYEDIVKYLDDIRAAAVEMEGVIDLGDELQNALSVVKALGKNLPVETRRNIPLQFKGNKQALIILKSACEAEELPTSYFDNLIFDADSAVKKLEELAYRLVVQPGQDTVAVVTLGDELERLAGNLGVNLSSHFRDVVDVSVHYADMLRAAAGVN